MRLRVSAVLRTDTRENLRLFAKIGESLPTEFLLFNDFWLEPELPFTIRQNGGDDTESLAGRSGGSRRFVAAFTSQIRWIVAAGNQEVLL